MNAYTGFEDLARKKLEEAVKALTTAQDLFGEYEPGRCIQVLEAREELARLGRLVEAGAPEGVLSPHLDAVCITLEDVLRLEC
jgi:hypothetical protein